LAGEVSGELVAASGRGVAASPIAEGMRHSEGVGPAASKSSGSGAASGCQKPRSRTAAAAASIGHEMYEASVKCGRGGAARAGERGRLELVDEPVLLLGEVNLLL